MNAVIGRFVFGLLVLSFIGCGSNQLPTYPVEGQIVFGDGGAPTFGSVEFYNDQHKVNARGKIQKDGSFTLTTFTDGDGAILGKHKVVIAQIVTGPIGPRAGGSSTIVHNHGSVVANKYLDYRTSGLSCEVKEGSNPIKFVVEKGEED